MAEFEGCLPHGEDVAIIRPPILNLPFSLLPMGRVLLRSVEFKAYMVATYNGDDDHDDPTERTGEDMITVCGVCVWGVNAKVRTSLKGPTQGMLPLLHLG